MLFNSYPFIFVFLPVVVAGFYLLDRIDRVAAIAWLAAASVFFYGWWDWRYVPILLASALGNFGAATAIAKIGTDQDGARRLVAGLAIAANLVLLGYFKYANFFVGNLDLILSRPVAIGAIALPIGISFFTFTQIAYLADSYRDRLPAPRLANWLLFVTYFPHLIAGPIIHHREMMPQFARSALPRRAENLSVGISIFIVGLFKKAVIADGIATYATPVFAAPRLGIDPTFLAAWGGALAYTFQLYFDFSGYSDMAVGLSRMLGMRLPINFDSPYKAASIIEFWRRWHMTLSRFLRDYLYIPLGGNRRGSARRYVNLMITMLLGGLWHGAGWTFIIWGGLHGLYLVTNNFWRQWRGAPAPGAARRWAGRVATFAAVVVAWVFFRADTMASALVIVRGMLGLNGIVVAQHDAHWLGPLAALLQGVGVRFEDDVPLFFGGPEAACLAALLAIVWWAPNTQQIMRRYRPALPPPGGAFARTRIAWRPDLAGVAAMALLAVAALLSLNRTAVFLYYQF